VNSRRAFVRELVFLLLVLDDLLMRARAQALVDGLGRLRATRPLVVWAVTFSFVILLDQLLLGESWGTGARNAVLAATVAALGSLAWVARNDDATEARRRPDDH
jgi:hypothetical protein